MSALGDNGPSEQDEVVLVFRPPENPAAQIAGITPFKGLRVKLDDLIDWFKSLTVDSLELWIEGAWKTGNRTEVFLALEGKACAKVILKPRPETAVPERAVPGSLVPKPAVPAASPEKADSSFIANMSETVPGSNQVVGEDPKQPGPSGLAKNKTKSKSKGARHLIKRFLRSTDHASNTT